MDWKARAEQRREKQNEYLRTLKQKNDVRRLVEFYLPDCFDVIAKAMHAELKKSGHNISDAYRDQTMSAEVSKNEYPRASVTMLIKRPAKGVENATIHCHTTGLGIDNVAFDTTQTFDIEVDDSGNIVYLARGISGGISSGPLSLPELVDAILGPFADCIGEPATT
jgi:hypothetical protein